MSRRTHGKAVSFSLAGVLVFIGTLSPALGQVRPAEYVRVFGRVQWIAAEKMLVVTDCPPFEGQCIRAIVDVDLGRLSPGDYRGVRAGSWVTVDGVISRQDGRSRLIARSVMEAEWESP
jgi:hypothetical protein